MKKEQSKSIEKQTGADSGGGTPQETLQDRIKKIAEKIWQLCDGEPLPLLKVSGTGRWWENEANANPAAESQAPVKRAYYERVKDVLEDDWIDIARIFEDRNPKWFTRIDEMRQTILNHSNPDQSPWVEDPKEHVNWVKARNGNVIPNKHLRTLIEQLRNELLYKAERITKETAGEIQPVVPQTAEPSGAATSEQSGKTIEGGTRKKRRSRTEKFAAITAHLKERPNATSLEVQQATGIDASDVRHVWGPVKKALKEGKRKKPHGEKAGGRVVAIDESASCRICNIPLAESFQCQICKDTIVGECKDCHFTNTHSDIAVP